MNAQNKRIFYLSLFLLLIPKSYSFADSFQEEIHKNSRNPKVITLEDQDVLLFSSIKALFSAIWLLILLISCFMYKYSSFLFS